MLALVEQHRREIAAFCRRYGVRRLDLFGFAAAGRFDEATSDLDFVADFAEPTSPATPTVTSTSPRPWKNCSTARSTW